MILEGIYRRFGALPSSKGSVDMRLTFCESVAVAQVEPSGMEMTRAGRRFMLGNSAAIVGVSNTAAFPTTTAQFLLWNADPSKTYFFETIGLYMTAGTPATGGILLFALASSPAQVGANLAGASITSASGGNQSSKAILKSGVTITTPTAPNWSCISDVASENIAPFPGSCNHTRRDIGGRIAIQPGQGLGLTLVAPTGTVPAWAPFAEWVELETDMQ